MVRIPVIQCSEGIYLRWYFNGWHYFNFQNNYEIVQVTAITDTSTIENYSAISKVKVYTKIITDEKYQITVDGISQGNIRGFLGLLMAEKVERYENSLWTEVKIVRGSHTILDADAPAYSLTFTVTKEEDYRSTTEIYIGDTLCDIDTDEIIAITKQVNDIAELQDRQSDYTQQFKIRRTRSMRLLFERSAETGAETYFPYQKQACKIIQNGIEVVPVGYAVLDKVDNYYYYVSIYSGNLNFFKAIEKLTINDLTLATTTHTWDIATIQANHTADADGYPMDYIYPLIEPSNDSGMCGIDPATITLYAGWIWPSVRMSAMLAEIFTNAGYTLQGDFLTNDDYLRLYMPVSNLSVTKKYTDKYLYAIANTKKNYFTAAQNKLYGKSLHYADPNNPWDAPTDLSYANDFEKYGNYRCVFTANYTFSIIIIADPKFHILPVVSVYVNDIYVADATVMGQTEFRTYNGVTYPIKTSYYYVHAGTSADTVSFYVSKSTFNFYIISPGNPVYFYVTTTSITNAIANYGFTFDSLNKYLPAITQNDFIKLICNLFALVPSVDPVNKIVKFFNYSEIYDNISIARDWSNYLSDSDIESEFKFGEYAQNNYLKYKDSDDVRINTGDGNILINDDTLVNEKEAVRLSVSTCDEVLVFSTIPISRVNMNKFDKTLYTQNGEIDPRIIYATFLPAALGNTFNVSDGVTGYVPSGSTRSMQNILKASSTECSFNSLIANYQGLSRFLTFTNLKRLKFNLPVYEVANLRHDVPIYLRQFNYYFYVNKITNYVHGKITTIELIKL